MSKQAVLLIHGIGEQKPMESLRGFVESVWTTASDLHKDYDGANVHWSKPDHLSDSFELRRLTTPKNQAGIRTDFFEFYWAHLMHGNKLSHVIAWARNLLIRWPWTVPAQLRLAYWVLVGLIGIGFFFAFEATLVDEPFLTKLQSGFASGLVVPFLYGILVNTVGDAARYLHPAPTNVQRRHEIRSAGVKVLQELHKRNYERIIIVGHSLGSVVGFDILYHAWTEFNRDTANTQNRETDKLEALEQIACDLVDGEGDHKREDIHSAQREYFEELKAKGSRWRITDFITLGSPLAHAEILLAQNREDLIEKFRARELATCLPTLETSKHKLPKRLFSYPADKDDRVPHHAAIFAPTRWTNLYFPCWLIVWGDLIGGKLEPVFGKGIKDIAVKTSKHLGFLSHTLYWSPSGKNRHIKELRKAVDLLDAGK